MPVSPERSREDSRAGLLAAFGISASLIVGLFLLAMPIAYRLIDPVPLPDPLPSHHQDTESLLFLLFFVALFPAGLWFGPRLADRFAGARSPGAASLLAALLAGSLALAVILVRATDLIGISGALNATFVFALLWCLVAAALFGPLAGVLERRAEAPVIRRAWTTAGALLVLAICSAVTFSGLDLTVLLVCLAVAALAVYAWGRLRLPVLSGWKGRALDLGLILLFMAAVPDIPIYRIDEPGASFNDYFVSSTQQFHAALYLSAANSILHGNYLLVDTVSQYGVGSIYFIAGAFNLLPMDYGTLSFLDAVLAALVFAMGFLILRMAGVARMIMVGSMVLILFAMVWGTTFPIGGILQNGSIRFGLLPVSFIFLRIWALWRPRWSKPLGLLAWGVVGLSAIWSLEALIYVTAALVGIIALEAMTLEREERRKWLTGQLLRTLASWVIVHVAFALFTLAGSGSLPDWGLYLTYLREFLSGSVGDLTYDYLAWSPALLIGLVYVLSGLLLGLLAFRRRDWFLANRLAMVAIGGLTTYGIAQYSYFANRSLSTILPFICLPAVLLLAIWLDRLLREEQIPGSTRRAALGAALGLVSVSVAVAWPVAHDRASDTALAWGLPGGESLRGGLDRLGNMPPLVPGADEGQRLLEQYMPDEESSAVLTIYDLDVNILVRAERDNSLGITDAKEGGWVPGPHRPVVEEATAELEAGDRMLIDQEGLSAFYRIRKDPSLVEEPILPGLRISLIQSVALEELGSRFDLKPVAEGGYGLMVVELVPRGSLSADELAGGKDPGPVKDQTESGP